MTGESEPPRWTPARSPLLVSLLALLAAGALATAGVVGLLGVAIFRYGLFTECFGSDGLRYVAVVEGRFSDAPESVQHRLVVGDAYWVGPSADTFARLHARDQDRLSVTRPPEGPSCLARLCWRISDLQMVEGSTNQGRTWTPELTLSEPEVAELRAGLDTCDKRSAAIGFTDLAVHETPRGPVVAVAAQNGGLFLRLPDGRWSRTEAYLDPAPSTAPTPSGLLRGPLTVLGDRPESPRPRRGCRHPSYATVTPDPRNGPPTTVAVCP